MGAVVYASLLAERSELLSLLLAKRSEHGIRERPQKIAEDRARFRGDEDLRWHAWQQTLAADLAGQRLSVPTVNGANVHIDGRNGVKVEKANVIQADILTSNGVIHVIDSVLIP